MPIEVQPDIFEISPIVPSPFRWGRVRVGVDKKYLVRIGPPSPSSPPTAGRGVLCCRIPKNVRDEFSDLNMQESIKYIEHS